MIEQIEGERWCVPQMPPETFNTIVDEDVREIRIVAWEEDGDKGFAIPVSSDKSSNKHDIVIREGDEEDIEQTFIHEVHHVWMRRCLDVSALTVEQRRRMEHWIETETQKFFYVHRGIVREALARIRGVNSSVAVFQLDFSFIDKQLDLGL